MNNTAAEIRGGHEMIRENPDGTIVSDGFTKTTDILSSYSTIKEEISNLNQELDSISQEMLLETDKSSKHYSQLKQKNTDINAKIKELNGILSNNQDAVDSIKQYINGYAEQALRGVDENNLETYGYQEGQSVEQYRTQLRDNSTEYEQIYAQQGKDVAEAFLDSFIEQMMSSDKEGASELAKQMADEQSRAFEANSGTVANYSSFKETNSDGWSTDKSGGVSIVSQNETKTLSNLGEIEEELALQKQLAESTEKNSDA